MNLEEIKFWQEVEELVTPITVETLEYRLHYNESGEITMCSMSNHPDSAQYLVVDKNTYDNYFCYKIIKGQVIKIDNDAGYRVRLVKSNLSGYTVVKDHAGLLLESSETYTDIEHYVHNQ